MSNMFNEYGHYTGPEIPAECIDDCSGPGDASSMVKHWQAELSFDVPRDLAIRYLREFGAWTRDELSSMSDSRLSRTVLWIACNDIAENGEWLGCCH